MLKLDYKGRNLTPEFTSLNNVPNKSQWWIHASKNKELTSTPDLQNSKIPHSYIFGKRKMGVIMEKIPCAQGKLRTWVENGTPSLTCNRSGHLVSSAHNSQIPPFFVVHNHFFALQPKYNLLRPPPLLSRPAPLIAPYPIRLDVRWLRPFLARLSAHSDTCFQLRWALGK